MVGAISLLTFVFSLHINVSSLKNSADNQFIR